ncbi:TIGR01841 family phasin [Rugamonas sp. CCM 8940]|uniref:TIGR01841 family phasin n=1 Tax=Rugamonas sp. CCM 8940 TaxID=2765359 RepID=UPI0018F54EC2|nr:TIGR01841 family phasin [Rugamonas sp. CCM 8940]MBJ7309731.1 phasin family protein [Rugamonas sp. CCM 8940]
MFPGIEQFPTAGKAQVEAQLEYVSTLAQTGLEGMARLTALHLNLARAALDEYPAAARQRLSAGTPQEWLTVTAGQVGPHIERLLNYGRQAAEITVALQGELSRATQGAAQQQQAAMQDVKATATAKK